MVNIEGLDKAEVLAGLYNRARPLGMGILHYDPRDMTKKQAEAMLAQGLVYFDYVQGRVMKVHLGSDMEFSESLYDRDNGRGAAQSVVDALRERQ